MRKEKKTKAQWTVDEKEEPVQFFQDLQTCMAKWYKKNPSVDSAYKLWTVYGTHFLRRCSILLKSIIISSR